MRIDDSYAILNDRAAGFFYMGGGYDKRPENSHRNRKYDNDYEVTFFILFPQFS